MKGQALDLLIQVMREKARINEELMMNIQRSPRGGLHNILLPFVPPPREHRSTLLYGEDTEPDRRLRRAMRAVMQHVAEPFPIRIRPGLLPETSKDLEVILLSHEYL